LVDVICDTSFLIHLANHWIKNLETLDTDIGIVKFLVPDTVILELENLAKKEKNQGSHKHDTPYKKF